MKLFFTVTPSQYMLWYFPRYPNPQSGCCYSSSEPALNCHFAVLGLPVAYLQWKPSHKCTQIQFFLKYFLIDQHTLTSLIMLSLKREFPEPLSLQSAGLLLS